METKQRHTQPIDVARTTHKRLKKHVDKRGLKLGFVASAILEAYLDQRDAGTDWLEAGKGGG